VLPFPRCTSSTYCVQHRGSTVSSQLPPMPMLTWTSVYLALVLTLIGRLQPTLTSKGLQQITQAWQNASDSTRLLTPWPEEFLQGIIPKPCHSHNDYWRRVPLYDALAVGCTGVEADIWLPDDPSSTKLRVGHKKSSLTADRTLTSLYVKPLTTILQNLENKSQQRGIFETAPNQTLTLLLDFKSNGTELWPLVDAALDPLRRGGWLRHWDAALNATVDGPLSIVTTGNAPFELITSNQTYRDIFYDAPLSDLVSARYDNTNSFYASGSMSKTIGWPLLGHFGQKSITKMKNQITKAKDKGLLPRYWSTPAWPVSARDNVWNVLVKNGVGMLNVDDLEGAARWNWDWCVVAGLSLCG
jgi:hypothetical protein